MVHITTCSILKLLDCPKMCHLLDFIDRLVKEKGGLNMNIGKNQLGWGQILKGSVFP